MEGWEQPEGTFELQQYSSTACRRGISLLPVAAAKVAIKWMHEHLCTLSRKAHSGCQPHLETYTQAVSP
jgi:hypothetical protein